jgi:hypothetical protein
MEEHRVRQMAGEVGEDVGPDIDEPVFLVSGLPSGKCIRGDEGGRGRERTGEGD